MWPASKLLAFGTGDKSDKEAEPPGLTVTVTTQNKHLLTAGAWGAEHSAGMWSMRLITARCPAGHRGTL